MATKGKESPSPKEKRVTSSSQPSRKTINHQHRKNPSTSKQSSPLKGQESHSNNASDQKHTPNYLKPTISSGLVDLSIHPLKKNNASSSSDSKLLLSSKVARRKSFDRPLLPSSPQKARISPSPKQRNFRSSSFTTRSTATTPLLKPLSADRILLKSLSKVDVGNRTTLTALHGKPVSGTSKSDHAKVEKEEKENINGATIEQITSSCDADDNIDHDVIIEQAPAPHQEDADSSVTQIEEKVIIPVNNNNEVAKEVAVVVEDDNDRQYVNVPVQYEVQSHEVEDVKMVESASIKGTDDEAIAFQNEKPEEVKMVESASMKVRDDEATAFQNEKPEEIMEEDVGESSKSDISNTKEHIPEGDNDDSKDQVEDDEEEKGGEEAKPKENTEGQDRDKDQEEGNNINEGPTTTEDIQLQETHLMNADKNITHTVDDDDDDDDDGDNVDNEETKQEVVEGKKESSVSNDDNGDNVDNEETKQEVVEGKKESSVSNDVIEETATKLREQRKNKVKALAGAFETVISLQEPK